MAAVAAVAVAVAEAVEAIAEIPAVKATARITIKIIAMIISNHNTPVRETLIAVTIVVAVVEAAEFKAAGILTILAQTIINAAATIEAKAEDNTENITLYFLR